MILVQITQYFLTNNDCYKVGKKHTPIGIMVHSTGANNPELRRYIGPDDGVIGKNQYNNHWNQPGIKKCVHAFIGKDKNGVVRIYQTLPWDMAGWHSGVGSLGYAKNANNTGYIGFEICEDALTDAKYFAECYRLAVELCAYLVEQYPTIKIENIIGHYEGYQRGIASNHGDPRHWFSKFGKSMNDFRNEVRKRLEKKEDEAPTKSETKQLYRVRKSWNDPKSQIGAYAVLENAKKAADQNPGYKVFDEDGKIVYEGKTKEVKPEPPKVSPAKPSTPKANLVVDGLWGTATTKALQSALGTTVDGVISGQYKNAVTSAIPSVKFGPPYTGSQVIRALQKKIGAKVDGFIGPETVRALQKYLGTPIDGVISKPSLMVKELQRRLNAGTF